MQLGKFMCFVNPADEDRALMDSLMKKVYSDFSFESLRAKFAYMTMSPRRFRRQHSQLCALHEQKLREP